jgi:hypothetical protein
MTSIKADKPAATPKVVAPKAEKPAATPKAEKVEKVVAPKAEKPAAATPKAEKAEKAEKVVTSKTEKPAATPKAEKVVTSKTEKPAATPKVAAVKTPKSEESESSKVHVLSVPRTFNHMKHYINRDTADVVSYLTAEINKYKKDNTYVQVFNDLVMETVKFHTKPDSDKVKAKTTSDKGVKEVKAVSTAEQYLKLIKNNSYRVSKDFATALTNHMNTLFTEVIKSITNTETIDVAVIHTSIKMHPSFALFQQLPSFKHAESNTLVFADDKSKFNQETYIKQMVKSHTDTRLSTLSIKYMDNLCTEMTVRYCDQFVSFSNSFNRKKSMKKIHFDMLKNLTNVSYNL